MLEPEAAGWAAFSCFPGWLLLVDLVRMEAWAVAGPWATALLLLAACVLNPPPPA